MTTEMPSHETPTSVPEKGTLTALCSGKKNTPKQTITGLFTLGTLLAVLGFGMMIGNWPGVEAGYFGPRETGNEGAAAFGALVGGIGQILLLIAVIATGVRLGTRADD